MVRIDAVDHSPQHDRHRQRGQISRLAAVHQTTIQVRWGELDPYNHVNNAVYLSYMEHARVEALVGLDLGMKKLEESGYQILVFRSDIRFKAPATVGDELVITTRIPQIKGASMVWQQTIDRGDQRIVDADIHVACVALGGGPTRIPDWLRLTLSTLD